MSHEMGNQKWLSKLYNRADTAERELTEARAEIERFSRYAEKHGDLSCCYDTEDVIAVIDGSFQELKQQLQLSEAKRAELISAWGDSWDCSIDAAHAIMNAAISGQDKPKILDVVEAAQELQFAGNGSNCYCVEDKQCAKLARAFAAWRGKEK